MRAGIRDATMFGRKAGRICCSQAAGKERVQKVTYCWADPHLHLVATRGSGFRVGRTNSAVFIAASGREREEKRDGSEGGYQWMALDGAGCGRWMGRMEWEWSCFGWQRLQREGREMRCKDEGITGVTDRAMVGRCGLVEAWMDFEWTSRGVQQIQSKIRRCRCWCWLEVERYRAAGLTDVLGKESRTSDDWRRPLRVVSWPVVFSGS